ncbi:hypothetical protein H4Q26_013626 [Puccinia striiformis f. sp. tritici PST-130]|nr:hypothetical protein H4Q26_013626 [Puccinia striiformis f. sp. tritici PST-130]
MFWKPISVISKTLDCTRGVDYGQALQATIKAPLEGRLLRVQMIKKPVASGLESQVMEVILKAVGATTTASPSPSVEIVGESKRCRTRKDTRSSNASDTTVGSWVKIIVRIPKCRCCLIKDVIKSPTMISNKAITKEELGKGSHGSTITK